MITPDQWGVTRTNRFCSRWPFRQSEEPTGDRTMDDVSNMDNVTDMDTLAETA